MATRTRHANGRDAVGAREGRPMPKSVQATFRVSPAEMKQLRAAARKAGYGPDRFAAWLRLAAFSLAGMPLDTVVRPEGGAARHPPGE